jgi:hypothetical protein
VATENIMQVNRRRDGQTDRQEGTKRDILRLIVGVRNFCERKIYEYRTSTEIFRSNIDEVFGQEKLEETNNRKLLSVFLDLLLT